MTSKSGSGIRKQIFLSEYTSRWPFIVASKKDNFSARCTACACDFSISHGGAKDISLHISRQKHQNFVQATKNVSPLASFWQKTDYSVIRAETLMANFLIEHNLPFSTADHLTELVKVMFPDSRIAKEFASKRTKSTAIARTLGQTVKGMYDGGT